MSDDTLCHLLEVGRTGGEGTGDQRVQSGEIWYGGSDDGAHVSLQISITTSVASHCNKNIVRLCHRERQDTDINLVTMAITMTS